MSEQASPPPSPPPPRPGAPAPPPAGTGVAGAPAAGLARRIGARLLDVVIVAVTLGLLLAAVGWSAVESPGAVVASLGYLAYFVGFEASSGATPGKRVLGLAVEPPTVAGALGRNWWLALGVFAGIPILGWLAQAVQLAIVLAIAATIATDDRNLGWHDRLAGTAVLRAR